MILSPQRGPEAAYCSPFQPLDARIGWCIASRSFPPFLPRVLVCLVSPDAIVPMRPFCSQHWWFERWPLGWALPLAYMIFVLLLGTPKEPASDSGIVGPQACAECHIEEHGVWKSSSHHEGSKTLSRSVQAKAIASALGIRRIKNDSRCTTCHFTMQVSGSGRLRATTGVSCESCHGAAQGWVHAHSDFGAEASNAAEENAVHRQARLQYCEQQGMVRLSSLYDLASNCYACHSIDDPEIIEVGGHPSGAGFELVSWSQGEVRHNFLHSEAGENQEASADRRAMAFVVGRGLELEYALKALEKGSGASLESASLRLEDALGGMVQIAQRVETPALKDLVTQMEGINTQANAPTRGLSKKVSGLVRRIEEELRELDLSSIFELLPDPTQYRGSASR